MMLRRIVKRDGTIEMRSPLRNVPRVQKGRAHKAMPDHEGYCRLLLFGERQELGRELAHSVPVKRHGARNPEAVKDREKQQWIFGRFSEHFRSLYQRACLSERRFRFRRRMALSVR